MLRDSGAESVGYSGRGHEEEEEKEEEKEEEADEK